MTQSTQGSASLSPDEKQRLRAILAEPKPQGALYETLRRHFRANDVAAIRLGDYVAREAILRERVRLVPDDHALHNLGATLLERGEIEGGNAVIILLLNWASNGLRLSFVINAQNSAFDQMTRARATSIGSVGDPLSQWIVIHHEPQQLWQGLR